MMAALQKIITVVFDKNMNLLLRSDPVFDYLFPNVKTLTDFQTFLNTNSFYDETFLARLNVEGREHHICYKGFDLEETYKFEFFFLDEAWSIINPSGRHDIKDKLTGVLTQKSFMPVLEHEINRSRRNKEPYTLILIDISHLKDINEAFGYISGDTIIQTVAKLLQTTSRAADSLGRYQGDKFLLLLNKTNIHGAHNYIQKLNVEIGRLEMNFSGVRFKIQVRYGIAPNQQDDTIDTLLHRAHENLKQAKIDSPAEIIDF
jgi:diguanylate cyclase (GGDEF)-like protein